MPGGGENFKEDRGGGGGGRFVRFLGHKDVDLRRGRGRNTHPTYANFSGQFAYSGPIQIHKESKIAKMTMIKKF